MFDSFSNRVGASQAGRFAEGFDVGNTLNGADNAGVVVNEGGGGTDASSFGGIASYQVCACCARFHGATSDGNGGTDPLNYLNSDDRGGFGSNGKPSLSPGDAGTQITRSNTSWATGLGQAATVTYAFRLSAATMPSDTTGFSQFSIAQMNAAIQSFAAWSDVANITFVRVNDAGSEYSNNATILLGNYADGQSGAAAFAYLPGGMPGATGAGQVQGDVWVNSSIFVNTNPSLYNYGTQTLLHEIGHAIGLSHPAAYNAGDGVTITYDAHAIYYEDTRQYTVMSYFSETLTGANFGGRYASAPLMDDIAAAQRLYGVNTTTRTGNNTYGFNSNAGQPWFSATSGSSPLIFCVWDAGGTDTFDFSGYSQAQVIDLRQGAFSNVGGLTGNVSIAIGAVIENAIGGSGADTIRGNSGNNIIRGGGGADVIDGGLGSDTVVFTGPRANYTITWNGQIGTVTATGEAPVTITNVEFLQFSDQTIAAAPTGGLTVGGDITNETISGTALGDTLGGLGGDDTLNGLNGDDYLDGGSGTDILNGGDGNDTLVGGLGDDALNGGAGNDTADYSGARSGITVDLSQGSSGGGGQDTFNSIENITGTTFADTITGDDVANVIRGGGGVDTLNGRGGDDQLFAGAAGQGGGAPDIIKGSTTANGSIGTAVSLTGAFDLMDKAGVFSPTTIPHATVVATTHGGVEYYAFTVAGNVTITLDIDGANFDSTLRIFNADGVELDSNDDGSGDPEGGLTGSTTDSRLTWTTPGPGTFYIQVAEWLANTSGGFTTTAPAVGKTYTLNVSIPNQAVQPITLLGSTLNGDAGADILTGGAGKDTLNGGADNDTLNGGAENDTLNGGDGTDTAVFAGNRSAYTISTTSGVTTITGPDGTDTLTNVERLQFANGLFDIAGNPLATGPIDGTPNADTLTGTTGEDTINGLGGDDVINGLAGNDTINGGDGTDTAVFAGNRDAYSWRTTAGVTTVTGPDGIDVLTGVEYLRFADGTFNLLTGGQLFQGTPNADTFTGTAFDDVVTGGAGADTLSGAGGNDTIDGDDGDDVLNGDAGDDLLRGGVGGDRLTGGLGVDRLEGGAGADILIGEAGADVILGGADNDYVNAGDDDDYVNGEGGNDIILGGAGADILLGAEGDDNIQAGAGADRLDGGDGADILYGEGDADVLLGGLGDDYIVAGAGADHAEGGDGADWLDGGDDNDVLLAGAGADISIGGAGDDYINVGEGDNYANGGLGADVIVGGSGADQLLGGEGDDNIQGGAGANRLEGGDGNDILYGGINGDIILGQVGDDYVLGGDGDDYIHGEGGADVLNGQAGADVILGGDGDDFMYGGIGNDRLEGGLGGDLMYGEDGTDTLIGEDGNDALLGGAGDDALIGGAGNDYFNGGDGADYITGGDDQDIATGGLGDDNISGGAGNDNLQGDGGADRIAGDDGDDILYGGDGADILLGGLGVDYIVGGADADYASGGDGNDTILGQTGNDILYGGAGTDYIYGHEDNDTLNGEDGADVLYGGDGNDVVNGGADIDALFGDAGNDFLNGGAGNDSLTGGTGDDTFLIKVGEGSDRIMDFVAGNSSGDSIQLVGTGWTNFSQVTANSVQNGANVIINLGGGQTLTLMNVTLGNLNAGDFTFVAAAPAVSEEPQVMPALSADKDAGDFGAPQVLPMSHDDAFVLPALGGDDHGLTLKTVEALVLPAEDDGRQVLPLAPNGDGGDLGFGFTPEMRDHLHHNIQPPVLVDLIT